MWPHAHSLDDGALAAPTSKHADAGPPLHSHPMCTLFTLAGTALAHVNLIPRPYVTCHRDPAD